MEKTPSSSSASAGSSEPRLSNKQSVYGYLVTAACLVVVVAGMRAARSLLVPFLLAAFFGVILTPVLHWLQSKGVRTAVALLIILGAFTLLGSGLLLLAGKSFNDFTDKLPAYEQSLSEHAAPVIERLRSYGIEFPNVPEPGLGSSTSLLVPAPSSDLDLAQRSVIEREAAENNDGKPSQSREQSDGDSLETDWLVGLAKSMLGGISTIFSNALIIFITVTFMLLEASRLPAKLEAAFGDSDDAMLQHIDVIVGNVRRYVAIKTATSALTGVLVTASLVLFRIDYAILWGLLAFMFNFVPNVGSIMAAVPAIALAFLQGGSPTALGVGAVYVAINCFISYAIEPRYMGQGLGLSTLVVFLSLVFWGWVLGPVGMLLSAPLTMIAKIVLDDYENTRWIAILLSSKPPAVDPAGKAA